MKLSYITLLVYCFVFYISNASFAQKNLQLVQKAIQDAYDLQDPAQGLIRLQQVQLQMADVNDSLQVRYYLGMGTALGQMGRGDSAIFYLDKAKQIALAGNDVDGQIKVANVVGNILLMQADHDASLEAFHDGLALVESGSGAFNEHFIKITGNLAGIYFQKGDFEKAMEYTNRALSMAQKLEDETSVAFNYMRLGLIHQSMNNKSEATKYRELTEQTLQKIQDTTLLIYTKMDWAEVLIENEEYNAANVKLTEAQQLATAINQPETIVNTGLLLAEISMKQKQYDKAKEIVKKSLNIAVEFNLLLKQKTAYDLLYNIALKQGNDQEALNYRNAYYQVNDSLINVETNERIAEIQTKYESVKKEAEIDRLELSNNLQQVQLSKAKNQLIAIIIITLLIVLLLMVGFVLRSKKQKAERIASEHQFDALKQRILELQMESSKLDLSYNLNDLNGKIETPLTEREHDALALSLQGKSNQEIADQLFVSINTIKFHLRNIYQKLGVNNKKEVYEYVAKSS